MFGALLMSRVSQNVSIEFQCFSKRVGTSAQHARDMGVAVLDAAIEIVPVLSLDDLKRGLPN